MLGPSVLRYYVLGGILMKSKTVVLLLAGLVLAATPMARAQQAGFGIGIAQPRFGPPPNQTPPVHAPAVAVRSTFQANPAGFGPTAPQMPQLTPFPAAIVPLVPNFPTVIVPNQI